jgi:hypothetical protein
MRARTMTIGLVGVIASAAVLTGTAGAATPSHRGGPNDTICFDDRGEVRCPEHLRVTRGTHPETVVPGQRIERGHIWRAVPGRDFEPQRPHWRAGRDEPTAPVVPGRHVVPDAPSAPLQPAG